ncbi:MAG: phage head-tail joining protein [Myxococcota bacterium]
MAVTQAEVDALRSAYYSGATEVRHHDGRRVVYQDSAALWLALKRAEEELAGTSTAGGNRVTHAEFSRG